jgi:hypothetical protein
VHERVAKINAAVLCPHPGARELLYHDAIVYVRMRIEAVARSERPVILVNDVHLRIGEQLARFQEFVEVGHQADLVSGNPAHDVARW